jgi:dynein heavy chain 1
MKREYDVFTRILGSVTSDLTLLGDVLSDKEPASNRSRALMVPLKKEAMPKHWVAYGGSLKKDPVSLWVPDFKRRVQEMAKLGGTGADKYGALDIWLGCFIAPEAFVAATRQAVAQAHKWSLEELELVVTVADSSPRTDSFTFTNLSLYGAGWKNNALSINNQDFSTNLPPTRFTWKKKGTFAESAVVKVPVYLDATRSQFLFSVRLARPANIPDQVTSRTSLPPTSCCFRALALCWIKPPLSPSSLFLLSGLVPARCLPYRLVSRLDRCSKKSVFVQTAGNVSTCNCCQ